MIPNSSLIVSPTEPTGKNRKKIWMQKGKNLFNKNNIITGYRLGLDGLDYKEEGYFISSYIPANGNMNYTVNYSVDPLRRIAWYDKNKNNLDYINEGSTFKTSANASFIRICGPIDILDIAQLEQGSTATDYKAYIEPAIYIKNKNDVYEKFM